jgi:hypothetical protein
MRSSINGRAVHRHRFWRPADRVARSPADPRPPPPRSAPRAPSTSNGAPPSRPTAARFRRAARLARQALPCSAARPPRRRVALVPARTAGGRAHLRRSLRGEPRRRRHKSRLREHGLTGDALPIAWAAIALHTTPGIPGHREPEVCLVTAGVEYDALAFGFDEISPEDRHAVIAAYPRIDFKEAISQAFADEPGTTFGTTNAAVSPRSCTGTCGRRSRDDPPL